MFALLEVNKILLGTPSKLRREMGMCATTIYYVRTAAAEVLYGARYEYSLYVLQSRASRSRCSIPGTWYGTCKHPTDNKSEVRGSVSRVKTPCEQGLPHCTYVLQAEQRLPRATEKAKRSFPMERGSTAKHHPAWNPQCTQWFRAEEFSLRGIRSARSGLGQRSFRSSALHRKSCHASFSVMLEKRGGCCRTDGPIRDLSCQMRHTIAAIEAAWCRSLC